ncbi:MAG: hypothetical protein HZA50_13965 [Planctomycetes bacterium]|nr:hypothetical protein [Planctomycetota bacterium]
MGPIDRWVFIDARQVSEVAVAAGGCIVKFVDGTNLNLREQADDVINRVQLELARPIQNLPPHTIRHPPRLPAYLFFDDPLCV